MPTVLFLCTGNYYRSRFAEVYFNALARRSGLDWRAVSRGLKIGWPGNVGTVSPHTDARLKDLGIDCETLRQMPVECDELDLSAADLVIALKEDEHRPMLADRFAGWENRVTYWHVHDLDGAEPSVALMEIEELVTQLIEELRADG